jgi:hypothetical protein
MSTPIYVQITAHDKHSEELRQRNLEITSQEDANKKIKEFEEDVTYKQFWIEITPDDVLTPEQESWLQDHDWSY